jgi:hypothetical protein
VNKKNGELITVIESQDEYPEWKFIEYELEIPEKQWLRMQLNILQPGTFWIDAINIEKE